MFAATGSPDSRRMLFTMRNAASVGLSTATNAVVGFAPAVTVPLISTSGRRGLRVMVRRFLTSGVVAFAGLPSSMVAFARMARMESATSKRGGVRTVAGGVMVTATTFLSMVAAPTGAENPSPMSSHCQARPSVSP